MKKLVVMSLVIGSCLWAGEDKKRKAEIEEKGQERLEKFLNEQAPQDVVQHLIGGFLPQWKLQKILPSMQDPLGSCVSANGKILVVHSSSDIVIFDTAAPSKKELLDKRSFPGGDIISCSLNSLGTKLLIHHETNVRILSIASKEEPIVIEKPASFVAFNPLSDAEILVVSYQAMLEVCSTANGQVVRTFGAGSVSKRPCCFSHDGKFIALSGVLYEKSTVWDIKTGLRSLQLDVLFGNRVLKSGLLQLFYSRDGKKIFQSKPMLAMDYLVTVFDTSNGKKIANITLDPDADFIAYAFVGKQNKILGWDATEFLVYTLDIERNRLEVLEPFKNIAAVAVNKDSSLAVFGNKDGSVYVWDLVGHRLEQTLSAGKQEVRGFAFSADGKTLVANDASGKLYIWHNQSYSDVIKKDREKKKAKS